MIPLAFAIPDWSHTPVLLIIGFAIFFGTVGAGVFQRMRIPQVVGYITIGLILGNSGLKLIDSKTIDILAPFNYFALGVIGFMIGGELHRDVFRKYGRQLLTVLLAEGLGAFVLVALLVGGVAMLVTGNVAMAVALGIIFGALSSATAPAATTNVLREYKARGVLTTTIYAIVALDDGLAIVLYSIAASIAAMVIGQGSGGLLTTLGFVLYELLGGAALGLAAGIGLNFVLRRARDPANTLAFIIGTLALVIGAGRWFGVDVILAAMALGMALSNLAPRHSNEAFQIVERFTPPLYVLFFVLVGAQLHIQGMPFWMWALAGTYIIGRSAGKILGSSIGARLAKAAPAIGKYLGLCLFSQGGVAVGLSIMAASRFSGELGSAIVMIIAVTTFIVELVGPPLVKIAITRAGEAGLNVTEEDLARTYKVSDVMDTTAPSFAENAKLTDILHTIAETSAMCYGVTDASGNLRGVITIQDLKQTFVSEGLTDWLVAHDLMEPAPDTVTDTVPLIEAMRRMEAQQLEAVPVVASHDEGPRKLLGLLELRAVRRRLSQEILHRHQLAEGKLAPEGE